MDLNPQVLWEDGGRVFCRGSRLYAEGLPNTVLAVFLEAEHPQPTALDRLAHEYELRDELESDWAVRPLALVREDDRTILILDDPGGEPLGSLLGAPMELRHFLDLAVCIAGALSRLHKRGLVHKDVKPSHIMVGCTDGSGAGTARDDRRNAGLYGA
jgi:serine/threonine protein kinase